MIEGITPEQVLTMNTEQLWNTFKYVTRDNPEYEKEHEEIKNGITLQFPIQYIINGWYETHPRSKTATIQGHGRVELWKFLEEQELRAEIMQDIIIENITNPKKTEPRIQ